MNTDHEFDGHGGHAPGCIGCRLSAAEARATQAEQALADCIRETTVLRSAIVDALRIPYDWVLPDDKVLVQALADCRRERDAWMASSAGYGSDMVEWKVRAQHAEATAAALREALRRIADEQNQYLGHGDYDIVPALTAEEAQTVARAALQEPTR